MTINDEITIIANQLANQGKKPTVALVKTKLRNPATLPAIISTLKNWPHDPKLIELTTKPSINTAEEKSISSISAQVTQAVEHALKPIKSELAEIKALLIELTKKQG